MTAPKPTNVDTFISGFPDDIKLRLEQIRETIHKAVPNAEEKFSYAIPGFKLNSVSVWFAAYKNHIGLYPMYGLEALEKEMAPYRGKNTRDSLHFPHNKPLPLALIASIVTYKFRKQPAT